MNTPAREMRAVLSETFDQIIQLRLHLILHDVGFPDDLSVAINDDGVGINTDKLLQKVQWLKTNVQGTEPKVCLSCSCSCS